MRFSARAFPCTCHLVSGLDTNSRPTFNDFPMLSVTHYMVIIFTWLLIFLEIGKQKFAYFSQLFHPCILDPDCKSPQMFCEEIGQTEEMI